MNRWNIPAALEQEIANRDLACVYCGVAFASATESRRARATWEHIINDAKIITRENIARCCASCNASKGARLLAAWLESTYCKRRGITKEQVAEVVRRHLVASV